MQSSWTLMQLLPQNQNNNSTVHTSQPGNTSTSGSQPFDWREPNPDLQDW